jgi:ribosomal protein S18 acetylase RimI-like enzyme
MQPANIEIKDLEKLKIFMNELVKLYQETFKAAPYFEDFSKEAVQKMMIDYVTKGTLIVRHNEKEIIGLLCLEYKKTFTPEVDKQLSEHRINLDTDCYISDLLVNSKYFRQGHGSDMVKRCIEKYQDMKNIYLRTARNGNDKVINFYRKLGFIMIGHVTQEVENTRIDGEKTTDTRIFMELPIRVVSPHERRLSGSETFYEDQSLH